MGVLADAAACMELPQLANEQRAHGSAVSDSNVSVDVVNVSVARNALGDSSDSADVSCGTKEPTPTSTLESVAALAGRLSPPRDAGARCGQPIMPAATHMAGHPRDAIADRGQPSAADADMVGQPGIGLSLADGSTALGDLNERMTRGADEQSSSTSGGSSGAVLPMTVADPGPPAEEHAGANNTAVTANDPPSKAAAVPRDGQAAKATPALKKKVTKKTAGTPKRGPSKVDAAQGTDDPAKAALASGKKAGASRKEPKKPVAWKPPAEGECGRDVLDAKLLQTQSCYAREPWRIHCCLRCPTGSVFKTLCEPCA